MDYREAVIIDVKPRPLQSVLTLHSYREGRSSHLLCALPQTPRERCDIPLRTIPDLGTTERGDPVEMPTSKANPRCKNVRIKEKRNKERKFM